MSWNQPTKLVQPIAINTPSDVSVCALRACASFGLIAHHTKQTSPKIEHPSAVMLDRIGASSTALITGASGAGKSCLLRGIQQSIARSSKIHIAHNFSSQTTQPTAMIDLFIGPLELRVATLSHAGLAEPKLWAMPASCLSVGERARLNLALAMHNAQRGDVVIADEFATPLDRASAYALAHTMRRWAKRTGITLIAATAHEDMAGMLNPDLIIDMNNRTMHTMRTACERANQPIIIEQGTIADYQALAHLHYRGSKPATHTLVLKATRTVPILGEILAGILVISMPTLNGSWRDRAWPGFFSADDKTTNAKRINTNLRCISRVIVEPRSRGLGVASALVRHYLRNPQTPATESIAAMGSVCPFFERSGMTAYELIPASVDLRLLDAIDHQQITLANLINTPIESGSLLERELITWSKVRKVIGSGTPSSQTIKSLAPIAACRLLANPRAYAHVYSHGDNGDGNRSVRNND
ncbi:hypothetical protein COB72_03310 [bacterium]|nr:MAG: hypothetical protein COB72_03310 [bacterium]